MSKGTNIARRFIEELWNDRNVGVLNELLTTDASTHDPNTPDYGTGPEAFKKVFTLYTTAFPDARLTIDELIDAGDKVVTRWTARGTHKGDLRGIPPTGQKIEVAGITIYRIAGDKIAEQWGNWNALGMMQQLGVVPETEKLKKAA
jgi:steroid delta-isomerase-like uncharacterized protein